MNKLSFGIFVVSLQLVCAIPPPDHPLVASASGTFTNEAVVTVRGNNFGGKPVAAPILFADFDASLSPSAHGQRTSWNQIQSIVWSETEKCAVASNDSGVWTLRIDHPSWFQDGNTIYIHRRVKRSFLVSNDSQNYKSLRAWVDIGDVAYPNMYISPSHNRVYVEGIGEGFWTSGSALKWDNTGWNTEEILIRASHIDAQDGTLVFRKNGRSTASGNIKTRTSTHFGVMQQLYALHEVIANKSVWSPAWSSNNRIWADEIYVDNTWARIQLGNAQYYTNCTEFAMQPPTAWSATQISFRFNSGTFPNGRQVYLYVFNAKNDVNPSGFPITIGSSPQPPNTPPAVAITNPTNDTAFDVSESITINASASDPDGGVARVDFFANRTNLISVDMSALFSAVWTNAPLGTHELTATATDNNGRSTTSQSIFITVGDVRRLTVAPSADTFLNINQLNYVNDPVLSVYTWPDFKIANVTLLGIDLRGISNNATIIRAELRMHLLASDSSTNAVYRVPLHVLQTNLVWDSANGYTSGLYDWAQTNCCYNAAPMAQRELSPAYDAVLVDKQLGQKVWNATRAVQDALVRRDTNIVLALNSDVDQRADRWRNFASMNHANAAFRPVVIIDFTVPDTANPQIRLTSAEQLSDGSFRFSITGASGTTFRVESSNDLAAWSELATISHIGGSFVFTDTRRQAKSFYRVRVVN